MEHGWGFPRVRGLRGAVSVVPAVTWVPGVPSIPGGSSGGAVRTGTMWRGRGSSGGRGRATGLTARRTRLPPAPHPGPVGLTSPAGLRGKTLRDHEAPAQEPFSEVTSASAGSFPRVPGALIADRIIVGRYLRYRGSVAYLGTITAPGLRQPAHAPHKQHRSLPCCPPRGRCPRVPSPVPWRHPQLTRTRSSGGICVPLVTHAPQPPGEDHHLRMVATPCTSRGRHCGNHDIAAREPRRPGPSAP